MSRKRVEAWAVVYSDVGICLYETLAKALADSDEGARHPIRLVEAPSDAVAKAERAVVRDAKIWASTEGWDANDRAVASLERAVARLQQAKETK